MVATGVFTSKVHVSLFHTSIVRIISISFHVSDVDDMFHTVLGRKVSLVPVVCNFVHCIINENELYRLISQMIELKIACNLFS